MSTEIEETNRGTVTVRRIYFGHLAWMSEEKYPNILLYGQIEGTRQRGRRRKKEDQQHLRKLFGDGTFTDWGGDLHATERDGDLLHRSWAASARQLHLHRQGIESRKTTGDVWGRPGGTVSEWIPGNWTVSAGPKRMLRIWICGDWESGAKMASMGLPGNAVKTGKNADNGPT